MDPGRRDAPTKVLKDRRSPRRRGRMGTSEPLLLADDVDRPRERSHHVRVQRRRRALHAGVDELVRPAAARRFRALGVGGGGVGVGAATLPIRVQPVVLEVRRRLVRAVLREVARERPVLQVQTPRIVHIARVVVAAVAVVAVLLIRFLVADAAASGRPPPSREVAELHLRASQVRVHGLVAVHDEDVRVPERGGHGVHVRSVRRRHPLIARLPIFREAGDEDGEVGAHEPPRELLRGEVSRVHARHGLARREVAAHRGDARHDARVPRRVTVRGTGSMLTLGFRARCAAPRRDL
eukprot:31190-Pelagococcus_subviridis.AAC.3